MSFGNNFLYYTIPDIAIPFNYSKENMGLLAGTKNSNNQYVAGYINVAATGFEHSHSGATEVQTACAYRWHYKYSPNVPVCVMMCKSNCLTSSNPLEEKDIQYVKQQYGKPILPYRFFILRTSNALNTTDGKVSSSRDAVYTEGNNAGNHVNGYPVYSNSHNTSKNILTNYVGFKSFLDTYIDSTYVVKGMETYYIYPDDVREGFKRLYANMQEKYTDFDNVMNRVGMSFGDASACVNSSDVLVSLQIDASIPIFYLDNLEEIYKYFKDGSGKALNEDELKLSEVNLATDWKIYVNGARRPAIYTTMISSELETFINDKSNGYEKKDFIVEYKYPFFKWHKSFVGGLLSYEWEETGEMISDGSDAYNNTRASSWNEIAQKNYENLELLISEYETNNVMLEKLYAQLSFRICDKSKQFFSAWCEFGIGIIGSPSVEGFDRMRNWGYESNLSDGSTVTIVYDEVPPGEDDYKDPDDIIPEPGDTEPSDYDMGSTLTTSYKVSVDQLKSLGNYLWGATFLDDIHLVNNNPIENIVTCKRIPFDLPSGVSKQILLGNVTSPANGNIIENLPIINIGSVTYSGYYGNFLDYSPYTRLILFLPFCGFTEIDPSVVTGKEMTVKYAIDIVMGKCRAMIFINDAYYASYDGNFGVEIPLTGSNRAQVDAGLVSSVASVGAGAYFSPAGTVEKVAKAAVGGIETAVASQYHSTRTGNYSSTCGWQETRKCFMIADIPTCQYPTSYAHDRGYPCMLTRTLATLNGFAICSEDVDLKGLTCTDEEIDMIREYLVSGIYL